MDSQTLLVLILLLLTANILFVGVYVVFVLKEVKLSVIKFNRLLDTVNELTAAISRPVIGLAGAVEGFRQGFRAVEAIRRWRKNETGRKTEEREEGQE